MLNTPLPTHLYAHVRAEFLRDQATGHGAFEPCVLFGVRSDPNRALGFHVLTEAGAVYWNVPVHALAHKPGAPRRELADLEPWDAFGPHVAAVAFPYLREMSVTVKGGMGGVYVCTIDWWGNGFSDAPEQAKCAHLLALDDGNFGLYPNNWLRWRDASFTKEGGGVPDYRRNTMVWRCEK